MPKIYSNNINRDEEDERDRRSYAARTRERLESENRSANGSSSSPLDLQSAWAHQQAMNGLSGAAHSVAKEEARAIKDLEQRRYSARSSLIPGYGVSTSSGQRELLEKYTGLKSNAEDNLKALSNPKTRLQSGLEYAAREAAIDRTNELLRNRVTDYSVMNEEGRREAAKKYYEENVPQISNPYERSPLRQDTLGEMTKDWGAVAREAYNDAQRAMNRYQKSKWSAPETNYWNEDYMAAREQYENEPGFKEYYDGKREITDDERVYYNSRTAGYGNDEDIVVYNYVLQKYGEGKARQFDALHERTAQRKAYRENDLALYARRMADYVSAASKAEDGQKASNVTASFGDRYTDNVVNRILRMDEAANRYRELNPGAELTPELLAGFGADSGMGSVDRKDSTDKWAWASDEERAVVKYLAETGQSEKLVQYTDSMKKLLDKRVNSEVIGKFSDWATENAMNASVASILTIMSAPIKGAAYLGQAADLAKNGEINEWSDYNMLSRVPDNVRSAVAQKAEEKWGGAGSLAYQTAMSMGDFLFTALVSGNFSAAQGTTAAKVAEWTSLAIMGTGAAASTTIEARDRGLSSAQAFTLGTIAGAAEVLTEKVSLEALLNPNLKEGWLKYVLKNALAEGSEEVASDIINDIADVLIAADKSKLRVRIDELVADGKDPGEAFGIALAEQARDTGLSFIGGFASGGIMAGTGAAINWRSFRDARNTADSMGLTFDQYEELLGAYNEQDAETKNKRLTALVKDVTGEGKSNLGRASAINERENQYKQNPVLETQDKVKAELNALPIADRISDAGKQIIAESVSRGDDAKTFALDMAKAYNYGRVGRVDLETAIKNANSTTSPESLEKAFRAGDIDRRADLERQTTALKESQLETIKKSEASEGVKELSDIKTFAEAVDEVGGVKGFEKSVSEKIQTALDTGEVEVYTVGDPADGKTVYLNRQDAIAAANGAVVTTMNVDTDDVAWQSVAQGQYTGGTYGENVNGGVEGRNVGFNPGRPVQNVEGGTSRFAGQTAREAGRAGKETAGTGAQRTVKSSQITEGGSEYYPVTEHQYNEKDASEGVKKAVGILKAAGIEDGKIHLYSGNMVLKDGDYVQGVFDPDTGDAWVQIDNDRYTPEQLAGHEAMHKIIHDGGVDVQRVIDWMKTNDEYAYNLIRDAYRRAYPKAWDEVALFEEAICDTYGGLNVFAGMKTSYRSSLETALPALQEAIEETGQSIGNAYTTGQAKYSTAVSDKAMADYSFYGEYPDGTRFSLRSMDSDMAEGRMRQDLIDSGYSEDEVNTLFENLKGLMDYIAKPGVVDILDLREDYGREDRVYKPYKPNSDPLYVISLDYSTMCRKRLMTQFVIEQLQLKMHRVMSAEEQIAIRDKLNKYREQESALQVACAMCYVEAARLKSPKQMQRYFDNPAPVVAKYLARKDSVYEDYINKVKGDVKESLGYERDATKKQMGKDAKILEGITRKLRTGEKYDSLTDVEKSVISEKDYLPYTAADENQKIIEEAKSLPVDVYLSASNLTRLSREHPDIYNAYTSFVREATHSKALESDIPYYYGDADSISQKFIDKVNRENGMRSNSWSDFQFTHLLDQIVATIELNVRGASMHAYTKFLEQVRMFGNTGEMFNLSGVPTRTGLDSNGNLEFSDTESVHVNMSDEHLEVVKRVRDAFTKLRSENPGKRFTIDDALKEAGIDKLDDYDALIAREEFSQTTGLQSIAMSKEHLLKLIRSDLIDYVIPYHTSGLNKILRVMSKIENWKDFTSVQQEKGKGKKQAPVFSEWMLPESEWGDKSGIEIMRESAERYKELCRERDCIPKFEEFKDEPNYWKLLIDRKMIDQQTGKIIKQQVVKPDFDFDRIKAEIDQYVRNYDPNLEKKALNYIVENWDAVQASIPELKRTNAVEKTIRESEKKAKDREQAAKHVDDLVNQTVSALANDDVETPSQSTARYSLQAVDPIEPTTGAWERGATTDEVMRIYPNLWNVAADESETRNPTQITSTVKTYRRIYDSLRDEGFDGTILDASSGLGYGTRAGIEEYGFDVDDIEPYPDKNYKPKYTDYSKLNKTYDAIISNAVLNVLPQEQRDALVVKMGEMLNDGGRLYVNVRSLREIQDLQEKIDSKTGRPKNITISSSEVAETSKGSYQKGFTKNELKAYLEDALGDGYTVEPVSWFGNVAMVVTKDESSPMFSIRATEQEDESVKAYENRIRELTQELQKQRDRAEYFKAQMQKSDKPQATDAIVRKLTRSLIRSYDSNADFETSKKDIADYIKYVRANFDKLYSSDETVVRNAIKDMRDKATDTMRPIVLNTTECINEDFVEVGKELKKYLKSGRGISISEDDRKAIRTIGYDSFNDYRKAHFGSIKITNDGPRIDQVWSELQDQFGKDFFPDDIDNTLAQLERLDEVLSDLEPIYENPFTYDPLLAEEALDYASRNLFDSVMSDAARVAVPTFADKLYARIDEEHQEAVRKVREAGRVAREARDEAIKKIKEHYKEVNRERIDIREETEMRQRLLKHVRRLRNKNLPPVTKARLEELGVYDIDTAALTITKQKIKDLQDLQAWYENRKKTDPDFISDPNVEETLKRLSQRQIGSARGARTAARKGLVFDGMSQQEVADLLDVLLQIEHEQTTSRKLIDSPDQRDLYVIASDEINNVNNSSGLDINSKVLRKLHDAFIDQTLTPRSFFHRLGGYVDNDPLYLLFQQLNEGAHKELDHILRANEMFTEWTGDKKFVDAHVGKNAQTVTGTFGGTKVTMTRGQLIDLYMGTLNDDNMRHIAYGGVVFPDIESFKKGDIEQAFKHSQKVRIQPSEARAFFEGAGKLTSEERAFIRQMQNYYSGMSHNELNETTLKLNGYERAVEDDYYPIRVDPDYRKGQEFDKLFSVEDKTGEITMEPGFLQKRIHATTPIFSQNAIDVLNNSIRKTAKYVGLAIPVRNFSKLYSTSTFAFEDAPAYKRAGTRAVYDQSVRKAIRLKWGQDAIDYITKLMQDLQGVPQRYGVIENLARLLRSHYAGAVLTVNPGVALKQAASYPTAAAVLGWEPLFKAFSPSHANVDKIDIELIKKYTPLLWYRSQGFSNEELGEITSRGGHLPKALNWIQFVDIKTTKRMWRAAEYYVQKHSPELERRSEAYYKEVARVYNRTIEETQPNYRALQRPGNLRSGFITTTLMMFKTQPFQNANILYDAVMNYRAKSRQYKLAPEEYRAEAKQALNEAGRTLRNSVSAIAVSTMVFAGMATLWALIRGKFREDDEDDKKKMPPALEEFLKNVGSTLFGMVPFGSNAYDFVYPILTKNKWWGYETPVSGGINDFLTAVNNAITRVTDKKEPPTASQIVNIAKYLAQFLGIPLSNAISILNIGFAWSGNGSLTEWLQKQMNRKR